MIEIDGSQGEGGGQILRTCLALSMCLNKPFQIINIRTARKNPGLQPQHLAAVKAATSISHADTEGVQQGSQHLQFIPRTVKSGDFQFSIGTAGSTTLLLQALLPALILADGPSSLVLEGGTHNPFAPTYDFLNFTYLSLINRLGPTVSASLERPGFAPVGGGKLHITINPVSRLQPFEILKRGGIVKQNAMVLLSHLPEHIAQRELAVLGKALNIPSPQLNYRIDSTASCPGNSVAVIIHSEAITETITGLGKRGLRAEKVAEQVVQDVRNYLDSDVPVGKYLADQILLPLALAGEGAFLTGQPTSHTITNMAIIEKFLAVRFNIEEISSTRWRIGLGDTTTP